MTKTTKKIVLIFSIFVFLQPLIYADSNLNKEIVNLETEIAKMTMRVGKYSDMSDEEIEESLFEAKKELKKKKDKAKKQNNKKLKNVGKELKKASKDFGNNMKDIGKDIGNTMKETGKNIGESFNSLSEDE